MQGARVTGRRFLPRLQAQTTLNIGAQGLERGDIPATILLEQRSGGAPAFS